MINGTLVLLAYIALTIVNVVQWRTGRAVGVAFPLSRLAGVLLIIQWGLGFGLLGQDTSITPLHYIIGLATLLTVGAEHGMSNSRPAGVARHRAEALATGATTVLVFTAYVIGQSNG